LAAVKRFGGGIMGRVICIAVAALLLAIPASASGAVYLSKPEARGVVVDVLDSGDFGVEYPESDWYVSYWVERARNCERISRRVVDCEFEIYSEEGEDIETGEAVIAYCAGVMSIRERRTEYLWWDEPGECDTLPAEW
jgi:hypothetical protein